MEIPTNMTNRNDAIDLLRKAGIEEDRIDEDAILIASAIGEAIVQAFSKHLAEKIVAQISENTVMNREDAARKINEAGKERVKSMPPPLGQKFAPGSRVRIAGDLGPSMSHFPKGRLATVKYTYAHFYNSDDPRHLKTYCLDVDGLGENSWYKENQLTAVEDQWPEIVG